MKNNFFVFLIILSISGCALYSDYYKGRRALDKEDYDEAIALFQKALEKSPDDPKIIADLGVAHYKKDDFQKAVQLLEKAKSLDPKYGKPYFYIGMINEKQDDLQKAINEYNAYYEQAPLSRMGRRLKARIKVLMHKQISQEIQAAIQQEKTLSVESIPENTIAVSYFSNLTGNEEFDPIRKGLTDLLIADLSKVKALKIVERTRLQVLVDELKLSDSALVDQSTTPRLGKLLGARKVINGGFAMIQEEEIRVDALSTDITTAQTIAQADVSGKLDQFFQMEKDLVFKILDDLQITLAQEERDEIQKTPTESFMAFLAYSRGLDYEDRGMYREASGEFQKAADIDPGFSQANEKAQETQVLAAAPMAGTPQGITQLEEVVVQEEEVVEEEEVVAEELIPSTVDRLESLEQSSASEFTPEAETTIAPTTDTRTMPQEENTVLHITIEW